ncbi:Hypothetical Protein FCC1311_059392 [Hondaea fermentalgiana]|uniref:Uncharacterized protein n=1 Tax=Hondaea fermentalgiana TaxID=2315210 RepID=A0A2R5GJ15_9STRA|nr:Hypothetical Protein FCC1311_059392 [Hondaea fermentalgiana]|eukprot:GBG29718.1 Hypothetical Protein FCC1311_059392 [Hondaea fermentalgiana]
MEGAASGRKRKRYAYRSVGDSDSGENGDGELRLEDGSVQDEKMLVHAGSVWDADERRRAGKMVPEPTDDMHSVPLGEELWIVSVPMGFDAEDLNGIKISGKNPEATVRVGAQFELRADKPGTFSQIRCMRPSSSYTNGLRLVGPPARTFHIHQRDEDEVDAESDHEDVVADAERERLRKAEEVVKQLLPPPREQIKFQTLNATKRAELLERLERCRARGSRKRQFPRADGEGDAAADVSMLTPEASSKKKKSSKKDKERSEHAKTARKEKKKHKKEKRRKSVA